MKIERLLNVTSSHVPCKLVLSRKWCKITVVPLQWNSSEKSCAMWNGANTVDLEQPWRSFSCLKPF